MSEEMELAHHSLTDFLNRAKEIKDNMGRSEGARLVAIAITEAEKAEAVLFMADSRGLI